MKHSCLISVMDQDSLPEVAPGETIFSGLFDLVNLPVHLVNLHLLLTLSFLTNLDTKKYMLGPSGKTVSDSERCSSFV